MNYDSTKNRNVATMRESTTETNPKSQSSGSKKWSFTGLFKRKDKDKPKTQTVPVTIQFDPTEELIHRELFGSESFTTPPTDTTDAPGGKFLNIPNNYSRSSPANQSWHITKKPTTLSNNPSPISTSLEERTSLSKYQQSTRARAAARRESLLLSSSSDDESYSGSQTSINRALRRKKISHSPLVSSSPNLNVPSSPKWEARVIYTQSTVEDIPVVTVKLPIQQTYQPTGNNGIAFPVGSSTDPVYANINQPIPPPIPPRREFNKKFTNFHRPLSCSYLDHPNTKINRMPDFNGNTKFAQEIVTYETEPKPAFLKYNNDLENMERNYERYPRMEDPRLNSLAYQPHQPATATLSNGSTSLSLSSLSRGTPSPNTFQKNSIPASFAPLPTTQSNLSTPTNKTTPKKNLEEALNELEEMYKSLRLSDEDLLDRAERRDLPTPHQELRDKPLGNPSYSKRFLFSPPGSLESIATTGSSTDSRRARQRAPPLRRSACPDLVNDDMAKRLHSPRETNKSDPRELAGKSGSYIAMSPVFSPPVSPSPVFRDYSDAQIMFSDSPDITLDDVTFRNIKRANAIRLIEEPQPPFGIPIGPVTAAPASDYLHSTPVEKYRPLYRHVKNPDIVKDDVAFRSLRKDLNSENNNLNKDWTPKLFKGQMNISPEKIARKDRAIRSMSANITNIQPNWNAENERNNNIWLETLQQNRTSRSMTPGRANYLEPSWVEQVEMQVHRNPFKVRNFRLDQSVIPSAELIQEKQARLSANKKSFSPTPGSRKPWTDIILESFKDYEEEPTNDIAPTPVNDDIFYDASEITPRETPYETAGEKSSPELETLMAETPVLFYQTQTQRPGSYAEPKLFTSKIESKRQSWSEPKQYEDYNSAFNAIMSKSKKIESGWSSPKRVKQVSLGTFQMDETKPTVIDQSKHSVAASGEKELNELIDALVRDADGIDTGPPISKPHVKTEAKPVPVAKERGIKYRSAIPTEQRSKPPVEMFGGVSISLAPLEIDESKNKGRCNTKTTSSDLQSLKCSKKTVESNPGDLNKDLQLKIAVLPDPKPDKPIAFSKPLEVSTANFTIGSASKSDYTANRPSPKQLTSDNESTASTSSDPGNISLKPRKSRRKRENLDSIEAKWQAAIDEMENSHKVDSPIITQSESANLSRPSIPVPRNETSTGDNMYQVQSVQIQDEKIFPVKEVLPAANQQYQDKDNSSSTSQPRDKPQPSPRTSVSIPHKKLTDAEGNGNFFGPSDLALIACYLFALTQSLANNELLPTLFGLFLAVFVFLVSSFF